MVTVISSSIVTLIFLVWSFTGFHVSAYRIKPFYKENQPSSLDAPLKRKARVWTDENFACILRHCRQHQPGSNPYLNCLSENCRRGMLAVERDLEYAQENNNFYGDKPVGFGSYVSSNNMVDNDKESEVADITNYIGACYKKYCPRELSIQFAVNCLIQNCDMSEDDYTGEWPNKMSVSSRRRMESLMADLATLYNDESSEYKQATGRQRYPGSINSLENSSDLQVVRKRRVNDEVSQCIQSYCGSDAPVDRVFCIVKHCHRSRSVYR